jgi:hypothetical protein
VSNPRSDLGQRVADAIKAKGGVVAEQVRYEVRTAALADEIAAWLRERGLAVNSLGETERLTHDGLMQEIEVDLGDGVRRKQTVTHPGLARFHAFEVVLPADAAMREIPGRPTPRPMKPPPQRRRRG